MIKIIEYDEIFKLRKKYNKTDMSDIMNKINLTFIKNIEKDKNNKSFKSKINDIKNSDDENYKLLLTTELNKLTVNNFDNILKNILKFMLNFCSDDVIFSDIFYNKIISNNEECKIYLDMFFCLINFYYYKGKKNIFNSNLNNFINCTQNDFIFVLRELKENLNFLTNNNQYLNIFKILIELIKSNIINNELKKFIIEYLFQEKIDEPIYLLIEIIDLNDYVIQIKDIIKKKKNVRISILLQDYLDNHKIQNKDIIQENLKSDNEDKESILIENLFNEYLEFSDSYDVEETSNIVDIIRNTKKNNIKTNMINSLLSNIFNIICVYSDKKIKEKKIFELVKYFIKNNILSTTLINNYYIENKKELIIDYPKIQLKINLLLSNINQLNK